MFGLSQVKTFKISGAIRKRGQNLPFRKDIRAVKKEDALQTLYAELGSRHKARRFEIKIINVEEAANEAGQTTETPEESVEAEEA